MYSAAESSVTLQLEVKAGENYFIRQDAILGLNVGWVTMKAVKANKLLVSSFVPE